MTADSPGVDSGPVAQAAGVGKPVVIDLCHGLGGWTKGFLAEGYEVIGFDVEEFPTYPGHSIRKDVRTLCGYDLRSVNPVLIVASPPCQEYSYRAMPWKRAKALGPPDNSIWEAVVRIARECGVPLVIENVKGAQKWVGRAAWHYGSFYLWGDVPALMPFTGRTRKSQHEPLCETPAGTGNTSWFFGNSKGEGRFYGADSVKVASDIGKGARFTTRDCGAEKVPGINWSGHGTPGYKPQGFNVTAAQRYREEQGVKVGGRSVSTRRVDSRKAASQAIAEIPFDLANWIARCFKPEDQTRAGRAAGPQTLQD